MKIMQGACFLACSNKSRTREELRLQTVPQIQTEILKNGTPASPATALLEVFYLFQEVLLAHPRNPRPI